MKFLGIINEWKWHDAFSLLTWQNGYDTKWITLFNFTFIWSRF